MFHFKILNAQIIIHYLRVKFFLQNVLLGKRMY